MLRHQQGRWCTFQIPCIAVRVQGLGLRHNARNRYATLPRHTFLLSTSVAVLVGPVVGLEAVKRSQNRINAFTCFVWSVASQQTSFIVLFTAKLCVRCALHTRSSFHHHQLGG